MQGAKDRKEGTVVRPPSWREKTMAWTNMIAPGAEVRAAWSDSGHVLKVEQMVFSDKMDVG